MGKGAFTALLHCFTSSRAAGRGGSSSSAFTSPSPASLTFKKSDELRDIARDVPLERMLVETDAPFLAPVPHRGKRNEPAYVAETARVLAEVKGVTPAELGAITTENALRLFSKMPPLAAAA